MIRIIERYLAEIIILTIFVIAFSSCTSNYKYSQDFNRFHKEVTYMSVECENCDEID